jgi:hypothetical protein
MMAASGRAEREASNAPVGQLEVLTPLPFARVAAAVA